MSDRYPRNKASIMASGIDPEMKGLNKVHAIKSSTEKRYVRALEGVENYWDRVFDALDAQQNSA